MNLDIILEYDGYYLLSDYLEKPNLREDATYWLIKKLPACFADPKLFKQYNAEITYWIICIISVLARALIIVFLSKTLFKSYLPDGFLWVLAAIIILFSFVTIWVDIKQRINNYL